MQAGGRAVGEQAEPADLRPLMVVTADGGGPGEHGGGDDGGGRGPRA
ncbi:hypothetical protein [Streptomyces sp. McG3]